MKKLLCLLAVLLMLLPTALAEDDPLEDEFYARITDSGSAGSWITWSLDDLRKYQQIIGLEGTLLDEAPDGWLTKDQVYEIVIAYMVSLDEELYPQVWYGVRDPETMTEELARSLSWNAVPASGTEQGSDVWYLWIYEDDWLLPALDCFSFILDAHTGDIVYAFTPGGWG